MTPEPTTTPTPEPTATPTPDMTATPTPVADLEAPTITSSSLASTDGGLAFVFVDSNDSEAMVTGFVARATRTLTPVQNAPLGISIESEVTVSGVAASATSAAITGLFNGAEYTLAIAAVNASGTGPFSAESAAIKPTLRSDKTADAAYAQDFWNTVGTTHEQEGGRPQLWRVLLECTQADASSGHQPGDQIEYTCEGTSHDEERCVSFADSASVQFRRENEFLYTAHVGNQNQELSPLATHANWKYVFDVFARRPVGTGPSARVWEQTRQWAGGQTTAYQVPLSDAPTPAGVAPNLWTVHLRNQTAEYGYTPGDEIDVSSWMVDGEAVGGTCYANATTIGCRFNQAEGIGAPAKTDDIWHNVGPNWFIVFRVWPDPPADIFNSGSASITTYSSLQDGQTLLITHGLQTFSGAARRPYLYRVHLVCKQDDVGYTVGDEIDITSCGVYQSEYRALSTWATTTHVGVKHRRVPTDLTLVGKTSGEQNVTAANWEYRVRVW